MKLLAAMVMSLSMVALAVAPDSQTINITRSGSQPSRKGPAENFTGSVRVDPLFAANDVSPASGAYVTFERGARSAWHTHPRGQILIVTAGVGRIQSWGGPISEFQQGDVVRIAPGVKHWHGASPNSAMTHIAIQEHLDGKVVDWMDKVSDNQYQARNQTNRSITLCIRRKPTPPPARHRRWPPPRSRGTYNAPDKLL